MKEIFFNCGSRDQTRFAAEVLSWVDRTFKQSYFLYLTLLGYSPSFLSPRSDQSGRNLADELGLSLSGSDVDEDSVMSGEVSFDDVKHNNNNIDPEILTSTVKPKEGQNQSKGIHKLF